MSNDVDLKFSKIISKLNDMLPYFDEHYIKIKIKELVFNDKFNSSYRRFKIHSILRESYNLYHFIKDSEYLQLLHDMSCDFVEIEYSISKNSLTSKDVFNSLYGAEFCFSVGLYRYLFQDDIEKNFDKGFIKGQRKILIQFFYKNVLNRVKLSSDIFDITKEFIAFEKVKSLYFNNLEKRIKTETYTDVIINNLKVILSSDDFKEYRQDFIEYII